MDYTNGWSLPIKNPTTMKKTLTISSLLLAFGAWAQTDCSTATPVQEGTYNAVYTEGGELSVPDCFNYGTGATNAIWYSYTPTVSKTIILSSNVPGQTPIDTRLHVYTGTCGALTCFLADDDSGGSLTSSVTFSAVAGTTYYFVFDNYWDPANFSFSLSEPVIPQYPVFSAQPSGLSGVLAVVDINGDYLDDMVSPSASIVNVKLQNQGGFSDASIPVTGALNSPTWSTAAGDYDKNGYNDLLFGGGSGASLVLANSTGTAYDRVYNTTQYVFSQRTNFVDINNDGNLDAFICHDVAPNVYFLNDGSNGAVFHQGGLGDVSNGGNYGSIWIDYDNDGDIDLFIAKCRGDNTNASVDQLLRNNGDGTFTDVATEAGFSDHHQSWSSAWADFDNDGDMDVMIGASSNSNGSHKLMRNNGDGTFTNVTTGSGFDIQSMLNIEHVAHDFNNDGWVDILSGNNVIMVNNGDLTFTQIPISTQNGPIGDVNNDGFLDIYNPGNGNIYMNTGNNNHWLKVLLKGVQSNGNGIGARIELHAQGGLWTKQIRDVKSGDGFRYMSSLNTHFGIGNTPSIERVVIKWPSGTVDIVENPAIDTPLFVQEGSTLGLSKPDKGGFVLYPNPAKDVLNIKASTTFTPTSAAIYTTEGRLVTNQRIENHKLNVSQLSTGNYVVILRAENGKQFSAKLIKQ